MKTLVIASGGFDSTVLMYKLMNDGHQILPVGFDYGQRHRRELDYLKHHCQKLEVPLQIIDIKAITHIFGNSALTNVDAQDVPVGHYAEADHTTTVVPNRNMIMLSIGASLAISNGCDGVAYGAHHSDPATYADTREAFAGAMAKAVQLCDYSELNLLRPFSKIEKVDIARIGKTLGVDPATTYSCYQGNVIHCGVCGTCTKRREAFEAAGLTDRTVYAENLN